MDQLRMEQRDTLNQFMNVISCLKCNGLLADPRRLDICGHTVCYACSDSENSAKASKRSKRQGDADMHCPVCSIPTTCTELIAFERERIANGVRLYEELTNFLNDNPKPGKSASDRRTPSTHALGETAARQAASEKGGEINNATAEEEEEGSISTMASVLSSLSQPKNSKRGKKTAEIREESDDDYDAAKDTASRKRSAAGSASTASPTRTRTARGAAAQGAEAVDETNRKRTKGKTTTDNQSKKQRSKSDDADNSVDEEQQREDTVKKAQKREKRPGRPSARSVADDTDTHSEASAANSNINPSPHKTASGASTGGRQRSNAPLVWLVSCLKEDQAAQVNRLAKLVKAKVGNSFDDEGVTHLIVDTDSHGDCVRTWKYLQAITRGCWIVQFNWITANLRDAEENGGKLSRNDLRNPANFEVLGNTAGAGASSCEAPKRARLALGNSGTNVSLFDGLLIHFVGKCEGQQYKRDDVIDLVRRGGASIYVRQPKASVPFDDGSSNEKLTKRDAYANCRLLIVYDEQASQNGQVANLRSELIDFVESGELRFAPLSHILDCVGQFRLFEFDDSNSDKGTTSKSKQATPIAASKRETKSRAEEDEKPSAAKGKRESRKKAC